MMDIVIRTKDATGLDDEFFRTLTIDVTEHTINQHDAMETVVLRVHEHGLYRLLHSLFAIKIMLGNKLLSLTATPNHEEPEGFVEITLDGKADTAKIVWLSKDDEGIRDQVVMVTHKRMCGF